MDRAAMEREKQIWVERYTDAIRKGIYKFADIGPRDTKETVKNNLMPEIENGTANETTVKAVTLYFVDQIKRKRITLEEVPDCLRSKVADAMG